MWNQHKYGFYSASTELEQMESCGTLKGNVSFLFQSVSKIKYKKTFLNVESMNFANIPQMKFKNVIN